MRSEEEIKKKLVILKEIYEAVDYSQNEKAKIIVMAKIHGLEWVLQSDRSR